jgi:hypothetical protein
MIYVLTAVLAILKLTVLPDISWWLVFTPIIAVLAFMGMLVVIAYKFGARLR